MSPFAPDRGHLHHRLLDIGHSHRQSVLIMYLWAALFAGLVVWLSVAKTQLFVFAVATAAAVLVLLLMSMPRLRWWKRRGARGAGGVTRPAAGAAVPVPVPNRSAADGNGQPGAPVRSAARGNGQQAAPALPATGGNGQAAAPRPAAEGAADADAPAAVLAAQSPPVEPGRGTVPGLPARPR